MKHSVVFVLIIAGVVNVSIAGVISALGGPVKVLGSGAANVGTSGHAITDLSESISGDVDLDFEKIRSAFLFEVSGSSYGPPA